MANGTLVNGDINVAPPRLSEWRRFRRVFFSRGVVVFGGVIIILFILVAIFAPQLAPYNPYQPDLEAILQNPTAQRTG